MKIICENESGKSSIGFLFKELKINKKPHIVSEEIKQVLVFFE
jgi:hypothetical protein